MPRQQEESSGFLFGNPYALLQAAIAARQAMMEYGEENADQTEARADNATKRDLAVKQSKQASEQSREATAGKEREEIAAARKQEYEERQQAVENYLKKYQTDMMAWSNAVSDLARAWQAQKAGKSSTAKPDKNAALAANVSLVMLNKWWADGHPVLNKSYLDTFLKDPDVVAAIKKSGSPGNALKGKADFIQKYAQGIANQNSIQAAESEYNKTKAQLEGIIINPPPVTPSGSTGPQSLVDYQKEYQKLLDIKPDSKKAQEIIKKLMGPFATPGTYTETGAERHVRHGQEAGRMPRPEEVGGVFEGPKTGRVFVPAYGAREGVPDQIMGQKVPRSVNTAEQAQGYFRKRADRMRQTGDPNYGQPAE